MSINKGKIIPIPFADLTDPATGKLRVREVNIDSDSYKVARKYMVRLEPSDFAEVKSTSRLALIGKMSREEFEKRFKYLTDDPPVRPGENGSSSASDSNSRSIIREQSPGM